MEAVAGGLHVSEMLGHRRYKLLVLEMPRRAHDQVAGNETLAIEVEYRVALKIADSFLGAENWLAERMIFPEILGEDFVHEIVRIVLIHFYLFEDHAPLAADVIGIQYRVQDQAIGENLTPDIAILVNHAGWRTHLRSGPHLYCDIQMQTARTASSD